MNIKNKRYAFSTPDPVTFWLYLTDLIRTECDAVIHSMRN